MDGAAVMVRTALLILVATAKGVAVVLGSTFATVSAFSKTSGRCEGERLAAHCVIGVFQGNGGALISLHGGIEFQHSR
jgi:hypothetical protein